MKLSSLAALLAIVATTPVLAQETSTNCHPIIAIEAASADFVKVVLPAGDGPGYSGSAYVLVFADNDRARIGGSAYAARACTDPGKRHPDAIIYTVRAKEGVIMLPVAGDAGFNGRIDIPQPGKPRSELPFFVATGEKEVAVSPPL